MTILVVDSQCHSIRFNMFSGILYNIIWSCITHVTIWYVIRKSPYFPRSWDGNQVPSMSSAIRRSLGWDSYWFDGVVCMFFYLLGYYMKHVWLRSSIVYMLETWIWCFFCSKYLGFSDFVPRLKSNSWIIRWSSRNWSEFDFIDLFVLRIFPPGGSWGMLKAQTSDDWPGTFRWVTSPIEMCHTTPRSTAEGDEFPEANCGQLQEGTKGTSAFFSEEWERPISGLWWTPCHKPVPFGDYFSKST